ncbi:RlmE family RNA methyltransferase [Kaistia dalseonensis]|uniref:Ribosomal RNA large subunit methyltransferase E n=1 Tax=Kaistia dalseonensis TaxID=410840 RepID=A0ABU0H228_9HYPH|nr:RlmE family RNA methyltransferase [Kaistia dalseonensis]MCX5493791.1 RlmE family RNA methyltransferase [Kaistia dalseonensis]MDQ0436356.1 23S rRNA (uridine2552-2'-O)-methyltransferase [Kaistia dalseonensis]
MTGIKGKGPGGRELTVKVKTSRGRTASSQRWLERQLNDPYVARSKREGYRSRAAYKLIEIDDKHHILAPGMRVVDLGSAPGGWCQVAVDRVKSTDERKLVVAIDYLEMDQLPGVILFQKDFLDEDAPGLLKDALGGPADVVLSDMAAPTTGHQQTDHLRTTYLSEVAVDFALDVLKPGGHFLTKVFRGGAENQVLQTLKRSFASTYHIKPPASRAGSVELFLLAKGFKGRAKLDPRDQAAAEDEGDEQESWRP